MRWLYSALAAAVVAVPAEAHFVFILPQPDGASISVVFSDTLGQDEKVDITKISRLQLIGHFHGGKQAPVACQPGLHCLKARLDLAGPRVVFGSLNYGVVPKGKHGALKPYLLKYYPKAVFPEADEKIATVSDQVPVELVPVATKNGVMFKFLAAGKLVPEAEITVLQPNGKKEKVRAGKDGLTRPFTEPGRYGALARLVEDRSGEQGGQKYEEIRLYATLVCQVEGGLTSRPNK